jgi:hypothetical protein
MNVTLKIDDELCRQARHRAVDSNLSLSAWMAKLLEQELSKSSGSGKEPSLVEAIGMDDDRDLMDFIPDRKTEIERPIQFP